MVTSCTVCVQEPIGFLGLSALSAEGASGRGARTASTAAVAQRSMRRTPWVGGRRPETTGLRYEERGGRASGGPPNKPEAPAKCGQKSFAGASGLCREAFAESCHFRF